MKYAISRFKKEQEDMAYAIYMTDTLYYNNRQERINLRFYDLINKDDTPEENPEDIVENIMKGAGLRFKE